MEGGRATGDDGATARLSFSGASTSKASRTVSFEEDKEEEEEEGKEAEEEGWRRWWEWRDAAFMGSGDTRHLDSDIVCAADAGGCCRSGSFRSRPDVDATQRRRDCCKGGGWREASGGPLRCLLCGLDATQPPLGAASAPSLLQQEHTDGDGV